MSEIDGATERARWSTSADAWERWADPLAEMADKLNQPLLDAAGVHRGCRVLDLASGVGEPALSAAMRAGPDGMIVGADLIPAMLSGALRRAAKVARPPVFVAADMTALPFGDACFDAVTCRFGIMFVPDAGLALTEARRVLTPGGRAAFMVWGARGDNALFRVIGDVVGRQLGEAGLEVLFRYAQPGVLSELMKRAGFIDVEETAIRPVRRAPRNQPFWRATLEMVFGPAIAGLAPEDRADLETEIARSFEETAEGDWVPLPAHVRIGVGRRV